MKALPMKFLVMRTDADLKRTDTDFLFACVLVRR